MIAGNVLATSLAILSIARTSRCTNAAQWMDRSIYQIMTDRFALSDGSSPPCDLLQYCGGTWKGIENKLDYIQDMGFSAIQISPVVKNFANHTLYGSAFHGYWPTDWYALNENFGTAQDLRDLAKALHDRDMLLMVDVVINDMAVAIDKDMTADTVLDYTQFHPFDDKKYYHPWCNLSDWNNNAMAQNCWLGSSVVALPDLDTEDSTVQSMVNSWIKELVSNYSIDGLRIDAAKHVSDNFLVSFVEAAGVFTLGEVYTNDMGILCRYSKMVEGLPNFVTYYAMMEAFGSGNMIPLGTKVEEVRQLCKDVRLMGSFSENHDLPRFATVNPDLTRAKNVIAFTILAEGIPTMYQLQEHHVPGNYSPFNRGALWTEHYNTSAPLYNLTATLNAIRTHAIESSPEFLSTPLKSLNLTQSYYITRRGSIDSGSQLVAAYFSSGAILEPARTTLTFDGGFSANTEVLEVIKCTSSRTDQNGGLEFQFDGDPKVWFDANNLEGSGLCGRSSERKKTANDTSNVNGTTKGGKKNVGARTGNFDSFLIMTTPIALALIALISL